MAASGSQELIQQLMKAEKEAEAHIANAKKNRLAKLKQARDKAEDDLKVFRDEQESKFQREMGAKASADPSAEMSGATQAEINAVTADYDKYKDRTVAFVIGRVLDVPTCLSDTQKQALTMGVV